MAFYSKVIAAVIGLLIMIGARYGLDLSEQTGLITDAVVAVVTAASVYWVTNTPGTVAQRDTVRATIHEGVQKEQDAAS